MEAGTDVTSPKVSSDLYAWAGTELSMGWVDPRFGLGWVGSGSRIFIFSGLSWVMGLKWQICEKIDVVYITTYACN